MKDVCERFREIQIVPVIKIDNADKAQGLARALLQGGILCAEVTFRTKAAAEAIRRMKESCPELLVGAGTVLNKEQVDEAIEAGAEFIVSPGLNPDTVRYCQEKQIPVFPGTATASEIEQAISLGLSTVKFFPAEVNGGVKAIKALSAPYADMMFMPTGGINENNLSEYLSCKNVIACGGSWMVKEELIEQERFEEIAFLCREALKARAD